MQPPLPRKGATALQADVVALLLENESPADTDGLNALQAHMQTLARGAGRPRHWVSKFALLAILRAVRDAHERVPSLHERETTRLIEAVHLLALGDYSPESVKDVTGARSSQVVNGADTHVVALAYLRSHGTSRRNYARMAAARANDPSQPAGSHSGDHTIYRVDRPRIWGIADEVLAAVAAFADDSDAIAEVRAATDRAAAESAPASDTRQRGKYPKLIIAVTAGALLAAIAITVGVVHPWSRDEPRQTGQIAGGDIMRIQPQPTSTPTPTFGAVATANVGDVITVRERLDSVGSFAISDALLKWEPTTSARPYASVFADISSATMYPRHTTAQTTVRFADSTAACIVHIPGTNTIAMIDGSGELPISDSLVGKGVTLPKLEVATYRVSAQFRVESASNCD